MKSIARNARLGAAALAVAAGCAVTIASESGLATAKPPPPGCTKASNCAGDAGTGGTNAKGGRLVTTVAGKVTTIPGSPIDTTFTPGAAIGMNFLCSSNAGCTVDVGTGPFTLGDGVSIFNSDAITCVKNCVEQTGTGPATSITGPPTTATQEGSANGGRTVSQVGSSAPSTVTGHH